MEQGAWSRQLKTCSPRLRVVAKLLFKATVTTDFGERENVHLKVVHKVVLKTLAFLGSGVTRLSLMAYALWGLELQG